MKREDIKAGRSYLNASGRSERRVIDIGHHIRPVWLGSSLTRPINEAGVRYIDTRLGKTIYGPGSGKREQELYLSAFAWWAKRPVDDDTTPAGLNPIVDGEGGA